MIKSNENIFNWPKGKEDCHIQDVKTIGAKIIEAHPKCCIGISGSVGRLTHTAESDIDLLVIDNEFSKNIQSVFYFNNKPVINILALSPAKIEEKFFIWSVSFNGQHMNYIYNSEIIYDPQNNLAQLKSRIENVYKSVASIDEKRISLCSDALIPLLEKALQPAKDDQQNSLFECFYLAINIWFLKNGIKLKNKIEHSGSFKIIQEKDCRLYSLIEKFLDDINEGNIVRITDYILNIKTR